MADEGAERNPVVNEAVEAYKDALKGEEAPRFGISLLRGDGPSADASSISRSNLRRKERAEARKAEADAARAEGENELRGMLGRWALRFVGFQIVVCDAVIGAYVASSIVRGETVPQEVLIGWMTSSLVEIIGILWVIARSLFPFKDGGGNRTQE